MNRWNTNIYTTTMSTTGTSTLRLIRRANPMRIDIDMRD